MRKIQIAIIGIICSLVAGSISYGTYHLFFTKPIKEPVVLTINRQKTGRVIVDQLTDKNLISSKLVFRAFLKLTNLDKKIRAGVYQLLPGFSMFKVMNVITQNSDVMVKVTIPEGWATKQIVRYLNTQSGIEKITMQFDNLGQYYLPETYMFSPPISGQKVLETMSNQAKNYFREIDIRKLPHPLKSIQEVITLASIVEKETSLDHERPLIAGVLLNRLKRGMRLQADPTVVFAVSNGEGKLLRPLLKNDLKTQSPYNTYINKGFPPGPICHPGKKSIQAVLNPVKTKYLYFVEDKAGGHKFAQTNAAHNKNVKKIRSKSSS